MLQNVELSRPIINQDNNSKLEPNIIHISIDTVDKSLNYQKPNITQSKTSGIINSRIIYLDSPFSQVITDETKNVKSNVLNSNIAQKFKTLRDVSLIVRNQKVPEEKIEDINAFSTMKPFIKTKYNPRAEVLRMDSKKELKKISLANKTSFKQIRHLSNTKKLNNKLLYTMITNPDNSKTITKIFSNKKLKNSNNRLVRNIFLLYN